MIIIFHKFIYFSIYVKNYFIKYRVSNYKSYYYYEINLYRDENENYTKCFLIYFKNQSELVFKYYQIDIVNNAINTNEDLIYYNKSMNPMNRGISCHNNDINLLFSCFYINENKEVIEMNNNLNIDNKDIAIEFKTINIYSFTNINNDTLIMSSFYRNKFKFFSCFYDDISKYFSIYALKGGRTSVYEQKSFHCESKEKIIIFSIFDETCPSGQSWINHLDSLKNLNISLFYKTATGSGSNMQILLNIKNIYECINLYFDEKEDIQFFQPENGLINFQFDMIFEENEITTIPIQDNNELITTINEIITTHDEIKTSEIIEETTKNILYKELTENIINEVNTSGKIEEINNKTENINLLTNSSTGVTISDYFNCETTIPQKINYIDNILNEIL